MNDYLKWIGILGCLCVSGYSYSQVPFFRQHELPEEVREASLDVLYQSKGDFIWLGGEEGLLQYDGFEFELFNRFDSTGKNQVTAIFRDKENLLWVGYEDGAIYHLTDNKTLSAWQPEEGLPKAPISGFTQDSTGKIWIATYGEGLYYWNGKRMYNFGEDDGLGGQDIYVLAGDQQDRMWVGTDNGISICWLADGKKQIKNLTRADGLPDDIIRYLLPNAAGDCWIGTYDKGFCKANGRTFAIDASFADWEHGVINCMELVEERALWIGTDGKGVWRFDLQEERLSQVQQADLGEDKIADLHTDWEGNLWILGHEAGLLSTNCHFTFLDNELENLQAIIVDRKNRLWVGDQTGLYRYENENDGENHFKQILPDNVLSLFEDSFGNIWVGTFGEGVILLHPDTGQQRRIAENNGLPDGSILSIDGAAGLVWLATLGGVVELNYEQNPMSKPDFRIRKLDYETELGTNFIYKVFVDKKGRPWFGTDGKGISVLEAGKLSSYQQADSTPIRSVYSITEDQLGNIWFSTLRNGIYRFDGKDFMHFGLEEGLRDLNIRGLMTDANGKILILHPGGVDQLDPTSYRLVYFGREVGVGSIDPNLNALALDQRGDIWIGANKNIVKYTALSEALNNQPTTILKQVAVNFSPLICTDPTCLTYDQNNLIFEYVGLWFTDPGAIRYRYKLEGYNHDWIVSKDNQAVFPSLPHGKYTFLVAASENGVFKHSEVVAYHFTITSPIWKQLWFIILVALLVAGLIYWWIRVRERRMQREASLIREKLESQFETLKSQINPHFLFNNFNTLITIIEEDPNLAVEYVEKLSDFYRSILQYREKELIPLEEELKIVADYTFLLQKRYGTNLKVVVESSSINSAYVVPLTLQMLVENAVKHNVISKQDPLMVRILRGDSGYITICNNLQKKIVAEASTGFGLESIVKRYGLLSDKKVLIREEKGEFKVSIPIMSNNEV